MTTLWLDLETFSECDLKSAGTHRYAEHESTQIIVAQWAIDDGEPVVWDCAAFDFMARQHEMPAMLRVCLEDPTVTVVAHNSHFDRTLLRHCWGIDVPIERWRDTMVKALAHGLPGSLDKVGQIMGVEDDKAKDKRGRELIQLFCKPRPKNSKLRRATRETHPTEWAEFLDYSRQDIVAMREIDRKLPSWNYRDGHPELALWHLDQKINDRGFAIDMELVDSAIEAIAGEQTRLKGETLDATDGDLANVSQRDKLLAYILSEYEVTLPDMKADTLRRRMEDPELPEGARLLISLRLESSKGSTAKYRALRNAVSADNRLRNALQFAGAMRTARWAGRIFQPQNLPRPSRGFKAEAQAIGVESLKLGCATITHSNVMQLAADCLRGCIVAPPGRKLVVSDLSNIEGRMLVWLAGEKWKLKAFAEFDAGTGADMYIRAYARAFGIEPSQVADEQRQIGKVMELALGYEGGVAAFLTFAAVYNMDLDDLAAAVWDAAAGQQIADAQGVHRWAVKNKRTLGLPEHIYVACEVLKKSWREAHPEVVQLWADAKTAVTKAILNPGEIFNIGSHLRARRDGKWLRIRLPSGRYLCYVDPRVDDKGQISYFGVNQYTRQWGRIKTYGGKLIENATQAAARDVMAANMPRIEAAGYEIITSIHDELPTETPDTDEYNQATLSSLLSTNPTWAPDIPLAAKGFEAYRYIKD